MALKLDDGTGQDASIVFSKYLLQILRLLRLYDVENVTFEDPIENFKKTVIAISDRMGSARIQSEEGMLYFNKDPVRGGRAVFNTIHGLMQAMEQYGFAEVAFTGALSNAELKTFFGILKPPEGKEARELDWVKEQIASAGLKERIAIYAPGETTGAAQINQVDIDESEYFPMAYARTLVLLREYVKNLRAEELNRYFTQKLHRGLQELCGMISKYEHKFLAMASVKGVEDYIFNHMANTGFLAMVLGQRMGISRVHLSDLGLAGMLSCLGKFRGPQHMLDKTTQFMTPKEKEEYGKHPYRLMAALMEGRKVTKKVLVSSVIGFQYDLSRGMTPVRVPPAMHPFSQIVRVCEEYDALTTTLPERSALSPDQALKQMIERTQEFDPLVMTVFTNLMGLFPTGTCVSLSSGEVAVVVHPNPERPKRPLVAVVMDANGAPCDGDFIDLAEKVGGRYPASITGSLDPTELGINVPDYLLA